MMTRVRAAPAPRMRREIAPVACVSGIVGRMHLLSHRAECCTRSVPVPLPGGQDIRRSLEKDIRRSLEKKDIRRSLEKWVDQPVPNRIPGTGGGMRDDQAPHAHLMHA